MSGVDVGVGLGVSVGVGVRVEVGVGDGSGVAVGTGVEVACEMAAKEQADRASISRLAAKYKVNRIIRGMVALPKAYKPPC